MHDGKGTAEQVTLLIDEVYAGKLQPHTTLTYSCLCHMAEPPAAAELVGHEVMALLSYDAGQKTWTPSLQPSPLYFNSALRNRVLRFVRGHP